MHRFQSRAPLLALLLCAALTLSGCALWRDTAQAPVNTAPAAVAADADKAAASANAGAQTSSVTELQKFLWVFSPYRPTIQQGNFVSQEMLAQLKVGQTKDQVRFILGTPLLTDIFHNERWDYPFRLARGNGELTTSRVTVYFKDDKVAKFDGGNLPTEREYIARIAGPAKIVAPDEVQKKEEAGSASIQIKK
ncbi:MAG: outer membrane protein assembly factor BamE [Pseudomonadota bacterium]